MTLHALVILSQMYEAKRRHYSRFLGSEQSYEQSSCFFSTSWVLRWQLSPALGQHDCKWRRLQTETMCTGCCELLKCLEKSPWTMSRPSESRWGGSFWVGGSAWSWSSLFPACFPSHVLRSTWKKELVGRQQKVNRRSSPEPYSCCSEKVEVWFNWRPRQEDKQQLHFPGYQGSHSWCLFFFFPQFQILVNSSQASLGLKALMLNLSS